MIQSSSPRVALATMARLRWFACCALLVQAGLLIAVAQEGVPAAKERKGGAVIEMTDTNFDELVGVGEVVGLSGYSAKSRLATILQ